MVIVSAPAVDPGCPSRPSAKPRLKSGCIVFWANLWRVSSEQPPGMIIWYAPDPGWLLASEFLRERDRVRTTMDAAACGLAKC